MRDFNKLIDDLEKAAFSMAQMARENGYGIHNEMYHKVRVKYSKEDKKYSYFLNNADVSRSHLIEYISR